MCDKDNFENTEEECEDIGGKIGFLCFLIIVFSIVFYFFYKTYGECTNQTCPDNKSALWVGGKTRCECLFLSTNKENK